MTSIIQFTKEKAERLLGDYLQATGVDMRGAIVEIIGNEQDKCDVGIVIALKEEFRVLFPKINVRPVFSKDIEQYYYYFSKFSKNGKEYRCVATIVGGMGPVKAALCTDRLISKFSPNTIVNIGLSGAVDKDIRLTDVIVAEQADDYLYQSKAIRRSRGASLVAWDFLLNGDPYKPSKHLIEHAKNLSFAHPQEIESWELSGESCCRKVLGDDRFKLLSESLLKEKPVLHTGNIASSTVVGAATEFVTWLLGRDRKYVAIEMESAGFLTAAYGRKISEVVIRGVSDYADARKSQVDSIKCGGVRQIAMENAIGVLDLYFLNEFI